MDVSADTWRTLSALLDQALDRVPAERAAWVAQLRHAQPALAPMLEKLLAAHATAETEDVLAHAPALPDLPELRAALARDEPAGIDASALAPGRRIGPWRLVRALGAGGMADVWLAERDDGQLTRTVALKLPRIGVLRRDLAQRFARERDILARLQHPHIARLYDAGIGADGLPWLAMEYVDGAPLMVFCDQRSLDVAARLRLFAQVLDAVRHAHANLVIHRDLKPSNILVTADARVHLLDFGIAKLLEDEAGAQETHLTQVSGRALTPDYASPEQVRGLPLTTATDVYSLGVLLYELLSGRRPYRLKAPSLAQLEAAILDVDPAPPSAAIEPRAASARGATLRALVRKLAGDLDRIAMKALAKAPADRYATVAEFADDLDRYQRGLPVRAQPAAWAYRARKFVARHRVGAGAGAAVVLAIAVGAGTAAWQARQAHEEAAKAAAVKDFLTDLFRANALEPADAARRRSLTAGELLEDGAARIGTHFADQPRLRAELQGVVGGLMHELALNDRALALRRDRLALLDQTGAPARERAAARRDVAETLAHKGDPAAARQELQAAIDLLDTSGHRDDPDRWAMLSALGYLDIEGSRQAAEAMMQQAADALARIAPQSVAYAEALLNVGEAHGAANHTELAVTYFQQALPVLERALGPRSLRLAQHRYRLAQALAAQRRMQEAAEQFRAALATLEDVAGKDHPTTAAVAVAYGRLQAIQGRPVQAQPLFQQAARALATRRDADPQTYTEARLYLGESYLDEGRVAAAGPPLEEAMQRLAADPGQDNLLDIAQTIYARYLLETGRYAEAEAQLVAARKMRVGNLGDDHPWVASLTNRIGLVQAAAGRVDQAEATFRAVLATQANREQVFGSPKHLATMNLAAIDLDRQRYPAALATMRDLMALFEAVPAADRSAASEIGLRLRLARALIGTGAVDAAEPQLDRIATLTRPLYEHAPVRITEHLLRARYFAARNDVVAARAEIAAAQTSLRAERGLGPHFERQVALAAAEVQRGRPR